MTCREFKDHLHDYLEEGLEPAAQASARAHAEDCKECRLAVERAQQFGRVLHHALDRSAAGISLDAAFSRRVLQAGQPAPVRHPRGWSTWLWLTTSPFRIASAAALVGVVLFTLLLSRQAVKAPQETLQPNRDLITFSIDVPFQTDRHAGVTHAEFSAPLKP
jgi:anti-sigma factor RsiW